MTIIYIFFTLLFGTVIFSFLNVVVYRLPKRISFVKGRSFCPSCGEQLKGYDMVPVLSWIVLGGRCRNCKSRISPRYPLVEALGGLCAWGCQQAFGQWNGYWMEITPQAVCVFAVLAILTVVTLIDWDTMEIPNELVIAMLLPAVFSFFLFPQVIWWERLIGAVCVSVPMLILACIIPGAFGGGDIKLLAAVGLFLGWRMTLVSFFIAIVAGGVYGIYLLAAKKKSRKEHFAFGPFLCVGIAAAIFAGEQLLSWYLGLIF